MYSKAAITVNRPADEVRRLWDDPEYRPQSLDADSAVSFKAAPGDRGTEIHVDLGRRAPGRKLGELVQGLARPVALTKVKDELRRFKQQVETGEIVRSEGAPEGEKTERLLKQRPAQPLKASELQEAGVR